MKQKQENKYSMYLATLSVLDAHTAQITPITAFADAVAAFRANVTDIAAAGQAQETAISGVATDKSNARDALVLITLEVAGAVQAYASANQNRTLFNQAAYTKTDLLRQSDSLLPSTAQVVRDAAQDNLAALADYGIDAPRLAEFTTAIDAYRTLVPSTRTAVISRKTQTERLETLFESGDRLTKERLDKLMQQFKITDTVFFTDYTNARVIVDAGTRHTALSGTVTDALTGRPIPDAKVTIVELDRAVATNAGGEYLLQEFAPDTYTVRAEASDYGTVSQTVATQRGKTTEVNFTLTKNP